MERYNTVFTVLILLIVVIISKSYGLVDIGKHFKICDRNSVDVNDCLVEAIQDGLEVMAGGIKELAAPPVDPYHQKELRVEYKRNQIMVKMTMRDIYVHGLKNSKVHDVRLRADDDQFYLEVDMTAPSIFVTGFYTGEGNYNSLQILATGAFNTTMTDLVFTWKLNGTPEKMTNETYVRIDSFYMRPDVGNMKSYLSNDNPDTRELINLGNDFVRANWKVLYRELLPYAQANWNKIGIRVCNKIFLKVPYDQLFPTKS